MEAENVRTQIRISRFRWFCALKELRTRGAGYRESGAFFLGCPEKKKVTEVIFYDDIDSHALNTGIVRLAGESLIGVWDICRTKGWDLLFDVHTHPTGSVAQSYSDQANPMVRRSGHTAVIVPSFAQRNLCSLTGCGIYEYLGNHKWRICQSTEHRIKLTLF